MIRVAIADDSPFTCNLLASYVEDDGECEVVGVAHNARATIDLVRTSTPDVLTLDLQMPGSNGLELLRALAAFPQVAVVVISGVTKLAAATTLHALDLGAVDFILKFTPGAPVSRAALKREILSKVKMAAASRRAPATRSSAVFPAAGVVAVPPPAKSPRPAAAPSGPGTVVIGGSTGGPRAIGELLANLPADFRSACVIVQHLPAQFTVPFTARLRQLARIAIKEAVSGDRLEAGCALVTPGSSHLLVRADGTIELRPAAEDDVYRPSIDRAMISAAESCGALATGVILTGMGDDGAQGLKRIHDAGGSTYAQELSSCVVTSMPERAIERGGAAIVARPERIAQMLAGRDRL